MKIQNKKNYAKYFLRLKFGSMKKNNPFPIRIHHGYIGVIIILATFIYSNKILYILGISLLISDIMHHLIFLPLLTGKTEFP